MADQKFKSKVQLQGGASLPAETASRAVEIDGSGNIKSSSVTSTELGHVSGVTSAIQTQLNTNASAISDHIADAADAHDASAISNVPAGNLAATTVQAALNELQGDVDDLYSDIAALPDPITYEGTYNATTNTPTLIDGTGNVGDLYQVNTAGTQDFGSGNITFAVGDKVVYDGAVWEKWDMTDAVSSVFGRAGAVIAVAGDYTAAQVTNTPAGTIAATTVQAAINELDGDVVAAAAAAAAAQQDIDDHIADTVGAHAASAISVAPSGNLASTDVQAALVELQGDIDNFVAGSAGDITETSFSAVNNQVSAANVTGLAFAVGVVRSFKALVSVAIDATVDTYEVFELVGVNKGSTFDMSVSGVGDESGVVLTITTAGQVQYTSANSAGFVSNTIKFRADTTTV